jgi:hypothetical protein
MGVLKKLVHLNPKKNIGAEGLPKKFKGQLEQMFRHPKKNIDRLTYNPPEPNPMGEPKVEIMPSGLGVSPLVVTPKSKHLNSSYEVPTITPPSVKELKFSKGGYMKRKLYKEGGSLLNDDRQQYNEGGDSKKTKEAQKEIKEIEKDKGFFKWLDDKASQDYEDKSGPAYAKYGAFGIIAAYKDYKIYLKAQEQKRTKKAEGGEMEDQMNALAISVAPARVEEQETHTMPDGTIMPGKTHEEYEQMLPDEEMEEDYVDFVVSSTLDQEDQNYLESALTEDAKLSEIFDQVVESASEFSGSGPIEGPGSEVSDSIPARLSDGEFVFTAKATDEIGADVLQQMMEDAEAGADQRQGVVHGGMVEDEGDPKAVPIQTRGSVVAQGNIPNVAKQSRQVEEEMLKSSPRRYYVPVSG